MTRTETLAVMSVLKAAYPSYYRDMRRSDAEAVVDLWATMFAEEPARLVTMAVQAYITSDTKGFPPHIGAIKESILKLRTDVSMSEGEAWALAAKAARNGSYHAQEEFDALPDDVRRAVGSADTLRQWAKLEEDELATVAASNFMRSYRAIDARKREEAKLPPALRAAAQAPQLTQ